MELRGLTIAFQPPHLPCQLVAVLLIGSIAIACPTTSCGAKLEEELLRAARTLLEHSRQHGYRNVGVLKFRVRKGDNAPTDRIGPLNHSLPQRLELALVLANRVTEPIGIVRNASDVAATIDGASHLDAAGRKRLFNAEYQLAWGESTVTPDAFVIGAVEVQADLKNMTVGLATFDRTATLKRVAQIQVDLTPTELTDIGASFSTRGIGVRSRDASAPPEDARPASTTAGAPKPPAIATAVVAQSFKIIEGTAPFPLDDPASPVALDIAYDGRSVPLEIRSGNAFVREPQDGQTVTLTLRRRHSDDRQRYAAVLKVNGENTLGRERQQDLHCRKWVLAPGDPPNVVRGYQIDSERLERFRVLSQAESEVQKIDYGRDVGTISLAIFRERGKSEPEPIPDLLADDAEDFQIIRRGVFPTEKTASLDVLKQRLITIHTRGLIADGEIVAGRTRKVAFNAVGLPVFSVTITYYRPE